MEISVFKHGKEIKKINSYNLFKAFFYKFKKSYNINDNTYKCKIVKNNFFSYEAWEFINLITNQSDYKIEIRY